MKKLSTMLATLGASLLLLTQGAMAMVIYDESNGGINAWFAALNMDPVNPTYQYLRVYEMNQQNPALQSNNGIPVILPSSSGTATVNTLITSTVNNGLYGLTTTAGWYDVAGSTETSDTNTGFSSTTLSFSRSIRAFLAFWDLNVYGNDPSSASLMLQPLRNGQPVAVDVFTISNGYQGAYGLIGSPSENFDSVLITYLNPDPNDPTLVNPQYYTMQNLIVEAVPEPSTFVLLGAGLCGFIVYRKRRPQK